MKQYVENKQIKWGFKFWYYCVSETEFFLTGVKKKSAEEILGAGVVLKMTESLENSQCIAFFDDFFNSPSLTPSFSQAL